MPVAIGRAVRKAEKKKGKRKRKGEKVKKKGKARCEHTRRALAEHEHG